MGTKRDEMREYHGDVVYEVWRRGGSVDRINDDRVDNAYWNGQQSESAAAMELHYQRQAHERAEKERLEQERLEYEEAMYYRQSEA